MFRNSLLVSWIPAANSKMKIGRTYQEKLLSVLGLGISFLGRLIYCFLNLNTKSFHMFVWLAELEAFKASVDICGIWKADGKEHLPSEREEYGKRV